MQSCWRNLLPSFHDQGTPIISDQPIQYCNTMLDSKFQTSKGGNNSGSRRARYGHFPFPPGWCMMDLSSTFSAAEALKLTKNKRNPTRSTINMGPLSSMKMVNRLLGPLCGPCMVVAVLSIAAQRVPFLHQRVQIVSGASFCPPCLFFSCSYIIMFLIPGPSFSVGFLTSKKSSHLTEYLNPSILFLCL